MSDSIEVLLHGLMNDVDCSVDGGVRREVGGSNEIAFDGRHARATGRRRHGEYSNAGVQIDHRAVGRYLCHDVGRQLVDQVYAALRPDVRIGERERLRPALRPDRVGVLEADRHHVRGLDDLVTSAVERCGEAGGLIGVAPAQGSVPESKVGGYLIDLGTGRRRSWPLGLEDGEYVNQWVSTDDGARGRPCAA